MATKEFTISYPIGTQRDMFRATIPDSFTMTNSGATFNLSIDRYYTDSGASNGMIARVTVSSGSWQTTTSKNFTVTGNPMSGNASGGATIPITVPISVASLYPSAKSFTVSVAINLESSSIGTDASGTMTTTGSIPQSSFAPTFSISASQQVAAPSSWGTDLYSNLSQLKLAFGSVSTKAGATVKSYKITFNGQTSTSSSLTTNTVNSAGNYTARLELTDSRGFTTAHEQTFSFLAYTKPTISDIYLERTDESGDVTDDGTYAKWSAKFDYDSVGGNNSANYKVLYKERSATQYTELTSGTLTSTSQVVEGVSGDLFNTDYTYDFQFVLQDDTGNIGKASADRTLDQAFYTMDFLEGGKGIAFGCPATKEGFECDMETWFNKDVHFKDGKTVFFDNMVILRTEDLNDVVIQGAYKVANSGLLNFPSGAYSLGQLLVFTGIDSITQIYIPNTSAPAMYVRSKYGTGTWGLWGRTPTTQLGGVEVQVVGKRVGNVVLFETGELSGRKYRLRVQGQQIVVQNSDDGGATWNTNS